MNCAFDIATQTATAGGAPSGDAGARFSALMQSCPQAPDEVYVPAAPAVTATSTAAPVMDVLQGIEHLARPLDHFAPETAQADPAPPTDLYEDMRAANTELLAFQHDLFRYTLMLETVNSTKQGVSTLFQMQG